MNLLNTQSLSETLNAVEHALLFEKQIDNHERQRIAKWIASRQGLPKSYAGMFAPTELDFINGIRLFTGERITTRAATGHILGEGACRLLHRLNVDLPEITSARNRAEQSMDASLTASESEYPRPGFF